MIFITQKNSLALEELKSIGTNIKKIDEYIFSGNCKAYKRLAFCRIVSKKINKQKINKFNKTIKIIPHNISLKQALKYFDKPKASLTNPELILDVLENNITQRIWENTEKFEDRRAHLRPAIAAHSLHPKIARLLVNLTGIKQGILIDPFCGSSGILIEAGLMGLKFKGIDIDNSNIINSKTNLKYFKLKPNVKVGDALKIKNSFSYLATDLPYGRSSKISKNLELLYKEFAKVLNKKLKKCATVMYPDFLDFSKEIKKQKNLKISKILSIYVHKNLTRKIVVINKK